MRGDEDANVKAGQAFLETAKDLLAGAKWKECLEALLDASNILRNTLVYPKPESQHPIPETRNPSECSPKPQTQNPRCTSSTSSARPRALTPPSPPSPKSWRSRRSKLLPQPRRARRTLWYLPKSDSSLPKPKTSNPKPGTSQPKPETLHPKPT